MPCEKWASVRQIGRLGCETSTNLACDSGTAVILESTFSFLFNGILHLSRLETFAGWIPQILGSQIFYSVSSSLRSQFLSLASRSLQFFFSVSSHFLSTFSRFPPILCLQLSRFPPILCLQLSRFFYMFFCWLFRGRSCSRFLGAEGN